MNLREKARAVKKTLSDADNELKKSLIESARGKKARTSGQRFELRVRRDLESNGWSVSKWMNNVELFNEEDYIPDDDGIPVTGKLVPAKQGKFRMTSTGFPDFIVFKTTTTRMFGDLHSVIEGIEVKSNGYLNKQEKAKCQWLLENRIFSKIFIAMRGKKRGQIEYKEFRVNTAGDRDGGKKKKKNT